MTGAGNADPRAADLRAADLRAAKADLRAAARARRDALLLDDRLRWDAAIAARALALPALRDLPPGSAVASTWPIGSEADPRPLAALLVARGHRLALPAIVAGELVFRAHAPGEPLASGGFGTLVPPDDAPVLAPDLLLVPLLAFDAALNRLGYGRGYYDRALAALPLAAAIGLAYEAQAVAAVPVGPTDRRLTAVVTEAAVHLPT